ncbi:transmembrane protein 45B-like [Watersipora subatra]|uniref:transmembrane protein 45B-like n=1 Tax=Watersipora subatra TaxID=2589382 RepID=UPI00355C9868
MGTLMGHVLPGSFFIAFSVWWLIRGLYNYYSNPGQYVSRTTLACCCRSRCFQRIPFDLWIFIILAAIGGILEIVTSFVSTGIFVMSNKQHLTMYTAFVLAAFVAVLVHHEVKFVSKGAEYMAFILALTVELVLFAFHLHGREVIDVHVHMLLVYTVAGCIVTTALEYAYPHSINAYIARHYTLLVQGTWFYQVGFVLYPPSGMIESKIDPDDKENIMLVTLFFAWHMIGCLIGILILSAFIYCCAPKSGTIHSSPDKAKLLPMHKSDGTTYQLTAASEDSD